MILLSLGLISSIALADSETLVATCKITTDSQTGKMEIYSSDNGDEGFLRFSYSFNGKDVAGQFTANIQDDGVAFLKKNTTRLYAGIEDVPPTAGPGNAAAVYLSNHQGIISGRWKSGFSEGLLDCQTAKR